MAGSSNLSAITPDMNASAPIKPTKMKYLYLVVFELNVYLAFMKKLNVTATQKPERLAIDWGEPKDATTREKIPQ